MAAGPNRTDNAAGAGTFGAIGEERLAVMHRAHP